MPQGNLVEVLGREVTQGPPGELMVESSHFRQRRPPCKTNKEMSDEASDAAALTYLLTGNNVNKRIWTTVLIGVSPMTLPGSADPFPHAMTPIGRFGVSLREAGKRNGDGGDKGDFGGKGVGGDKGGSGSKGGGAIRGEKERSMGADVGRSARKR